MINMHIFFQILLAAVILSNVGCSGKKQEKKQKQVETIEELKKQQVTLPDSLKIFYQDSLFLSEDIELYSANIKIVTNIDGNCDACIKKMNHWNSLVDLAKEYDNMSILFYVQTNDIDFFKNEICERNNLKNDYPLLIDKNYSFLKINDIPARPLYRTMLIDSNNRILLVGNPINNDKLMKLYKEEINKRLD